MIETALEKVIGKTDGEWWGQVHDFIPEEDIKKKRRGRLTVIVGMKKPEGMPEVEMVSLGREILAKLHEEYYGEITTGIMEKLKQAVQKLMDEYGEIELTAAVITEKEIYLAISGGKIWVRNNGKEGFLEDSSTVRKVSTYSGWGKTGEIIVMGNNKFWQSIPVGMLKSSLEKNEEETGETLTAEIHGSENGGGEAGVILRITDRPVKDTAEEVIVEQREIKEETKQNWKERLESLIPKRGGPVYVNYEDKSKKRKRTMWIGLASLLVLGGLGAAGRMNLQQTALKNSATNQQILDLVDKYNTAQSLVGLNPVRIKQLDSEIRAGLANLGEQKKDPRVAEILQGLPELEDQVSGKRKTTVSELIDISLLRPGSTSDQIVKGDNVLWVLDKSGNRIISVDPAKGKGEAAAGEDKLGKVNWLAAYPGKVEIKSDKGVVECKSDGSQCSAKIKNDPEWKDIAAIGMFAGNIYLLDRGNNQIWRYAVTDNGTGGKIKWIGLDQKVDLTGAGSMTIDGSIWIITKTEAKIYKFNRGVLQDFSLGELDKPIGNNPAIFTDENTDNLYILDKDNNRVAAIKKSTGEYVFQTEMKEAGMATGITVDEANKTIYLSGGTKVWKAVWQE